MGKMLRFEFRKLFKMTSFYICTAIAIASTILSVAIVFALYKFSSEQLGLVGYTIDNLVGARAIFNSYNDSNFGTILAVFIAMFICIDYSNDTMKNLVGRGYSREVNFFAKYIVGLAATGIMMALIFGVEIGLGTAFFGFGEVLSLYFVRLLVLILAGIAYYSIFFAIGMMIRKIGIVITIGILLFTLVGLILRGVDLLINNDAIKISSFWLDGVVSNMASGEPDFVKGFLSPILIGGGITVGAFFVNRKLEIK